jgi:mediator of RNA polymerase II transcription subunit 5
LSQRVDVDEFKDLSKLMLNRSPVKEDELLDLLLGARAASSVTWDPLLPVYVDGLCKVGQVKPSTALTSLLKHSSIRANAESKSQISTLMIDIKVIQDVMMAVSTGAIPRAAAEAADLFASTVEWIDAVVSWYNGSLDIMQQPSGLLNNPDAVSLFESVGILLAALFNTPKGIDALTSNWIDRAHQGMS